VGLVECTLLEDTVHVTFHKDQQLFSKTDFLSHLLHPELLSGTDGITVRDLLLEGLFVKHETQPVRQTNFCRQTRWNF
jgi:hypothetical protein